MKSKVSFE